MLHMENNMFACWWMQLCRDNVHVILPQDCVFANSVQLRWFGFTMSLRIKERRNWFLSWSCFAVVALCVFQCCTFSVAGSAPQFVATHSLTLFSFVLWCQVGSFCQNGKWPAVFVEAKLPVRNLQQLLKTAWSRATKPSTVQKNPVTRKKPPYDFGVDMGGGQSAARRKTARHWNTFVYSLNKRWEREKLLRLCGCLSRGNCCNFLSKWSDWSLSATNESSKVSIRSHLVQEIDPHEADRNKVPTWVPCPLTGVLKCPFFRCWCETLAKNQQFWFQSRFNAKAVSIRRRQVVEISWDKKQKFPVCELDWF